MTGILVVTHHTLAESLIRTLEMLAGKHEFLDSLGLFPGQEPELFGEEIKKKIEEFKTKGYDDVIVVLDLYGGTPSNQTVRLLIDNELQVIVGVNLPMLLQLVLSNNENNTVEEIVKTAIEVGKESIFDVKEKLQLFKKEE